MTHYEEYLKQVEAERRMLKLAMGGVLTLIVAGLTLGACAAFAQQALESPETGDDLAKLAATLIDGVSKGHWGLVVSVVLVLIVSLVRRFGRNIPKVGPLLDHPIVAWALPTVASVGGALVTSLVAGSTVSVGLVLSAIVTGLTSNALYVGGKKVAEAREAGQAAAAEVTDKAAAVTVLRGPTP